MGLRLRLQTSAPLPALKCWFALPSNVHLNQVDSLKEHLSRELDVFVQAGVSASQLQLLLDDFELLDDSPLDILRDGDLLQLKRNYLKMSESDSTLQRKRKRQSVSPGPAPVKSAKLSSSQKKSKPSGTRFSPVAVASSSSDSSSSSSSDADTSTSEDDSSLSSSDSDSDSDSDESEVAAVERITRVSAQPSPQSAVASDQATHAQPSIPPGQGKPSTHSRNKRRRLKRKYDQAQPTSGSAPPTFNASDANSVPLGAVDDATDSPEEVEEVQPRPQIMMASLRNKNKSKGFRRSMHAPIPARIVFDEEPVDRASVPVTEVAGSPEAQPTITPPVSHYTRVVAPSERQEAGELPPNMFVTSIDVEEGMWLKKSKRNKKGTREWKEEIMEQSLDEESALVELFYGEPETPLASFDYTTADQGWDTYIPISDLQQIQHGILVGWKALAINALTFSPENMLTVARISTAEGHRIGVERIAREGEMDIAFRPRRDSEEQEDEMEVASSPEQIQFFEEETVSPSDVLSAGWKIVPLQL